jgi:AcrR family transcriptional regulator
MPWMANAALRTGDDPKQQLLERALGYFTEHGISDISLRELAAALGTSHRMLIYHFGIERGLVRRCGSGGREAPASAARQSVRR